MITKEMQARIEEEVAKSLTQDPRLLREKIQNEFDAQEVYVTNDELYFAILAEVEKQTPVVEEVETEENTTNEEDILTDPLTGEPIIG